MTNPNATSNTTSDAISGTTSEASSGTTSSKQVTVDPPKPFQYNDRNRHTAAIRWPIYKTEFDYFLSASGIDHDPQKKSLLLWSGGEALRAVYHNKAKNTEKDSYADVCKVLLEHFKSGLNKDAAILLFRQTLQKEGEALDDFVVRLRSIAKDCGFSDED